MALADLQQLKLHLDITVTTKDELLQQLLDQASAAVERYCHRTFSQATYTEYYSGEGDSGLVLRQYPVLSVTSVYLDHSGYFGRGTDPFPATSLLTDGQDYSLELDGEDGAGGSGGASGVLMRLGTPRDIGGYGGRYMSTSNRLISGWPSGQGNLKITYRAGYDPIPDDVQLAVLQTAATVYKTRLMGGLRMGSESLGKYSYSLLWGNVSDTADGTMGGVRQLLSTYIRRGF